MNKSGNPAEEALRSRVEGYLRGAFDSVTSMDPLRAGATWGFIAVTAAGLKIVVGYFPRFRDAVVVGAGLTVHEVTQRKFSELPKLERRRHLEEIAIDFLKGNVQFSGLQDPPVSIWVQTIVYGDGLTQDSLAERSLRVAQHISVADIRLSRIAGVEARIENVEPFSVN